MKPHGAAIPILVSVLLAGGYLLRQASDPGAPGTRHASSVRIGNASSGSSGNAPLSPASVRRSSAPREPHGDPRGARVAGPRPGSGALQASMIRYRFETAIDYRALFDELEASSAAESPFFAAQILHRCFEVAEQGFDEAVAQFAAAVPADGSDTTSRIAAFRQLKGPCQRFGGRPVEPAEIGALLAEGARRGDLRAISAVPAMGKLEAVEMALATAGAAMLDSADPYVLGNAANLLSIRTDGVLVIDNQPIDGRDRDAAHLAWDLVACDHGRPCGPDSEALLGACAFEGHCAAATLEDLVRNEYKSVAEFGRVQHFRERILAALAVGDFASLGVVPSGPRN